MDARGRASSEGLVDMGISNSTSTSGRFQLVGEREKLDRSRGLKLLKPLTEPDSQLYTKICFSGKSFGTDAAVVAVDALRQLKTRLENDNKCVLEIDFGDIIAGQKEDDAMEVLNRLCAAMADCRELEHVDLSNNSLGLKGVSACSRLLQDKPRLRRLYLNNNGLNEDAARMLKQIFRGTSSFEVLHFHNNLLESAGAVQLSHIVNSSPQLQELVLSSTRVGRVGAMAIGQALRSSQSLAYLDLSDNTFGEEGGETLALALRTQPNLRVLNLRDTSIGDQGVRLVAQAIRDSAPALEVLDLSANELTGDSAEAIADAIRDKKQLRSLLLEENQLRSKGAMVVVQALSASTHPELELLSLASNEITGRKAVDICLAVTALPKLKRFELDANRIPQSLVGTLQTICGDVLGSLEENNGEFDGEESVTTISDFGNKGKGPSPAMVKSRKDSYLNFLHNHREHAMDTRDTGQQMRLLPRLGPFLRMSFSPLSHTPSSPMAAFPEIQKPAARRESSSAPGDDILVTAKSLKNELLSARKELSTYTKSKCVVVSSSQIPGD